MLKASGLLLLAFCEALASVPACAISGAAAAGDSIYLLCDRNQLLFSNDSGANWRSAPVPTDALLRAVYFLDDRRGFIAGDAGTLLATENGGRNWRKVNLITTENLTSIHFAGESGWVTGWSGVILHTPDAGRTWRGV